MDDLVSGVLRIVLPRSLGCDEIEFPCPDLLKVHGLDAEAYLRANGDIHEGDSWHSHHRVRADNHTLEVLGKSMWIQTDLIHAALLLFAQSIVEYEPNKKRIGPFHYYPPAVLTFWAGFESFVRFASTMMVETVRDVPDDVANFLLEKNRYHPVLDRYAKLLEYGYGYKPDKGAEWWQRLKQSGELRDHFTHIRTDTPRGITTEEVLTFFEAVVIGLIKPSVDLQRSLALGQYRIYNAIRLLRCQGKSYTEQPRLLDWRMSGGPFCFHCNFANVDDERFPSVNDYGRVERLSANSKCQD